MQFSPNAWEQLRRHAAAQLPANFADGVLRAARQTAQPERSVSIFLSPFGLSLATAALCLVTVVAFHTHNTRTITEQRLAEWNEISMQVARLDPLP